MADGTLFLAPQEIPEETLVLMADIVRFSRAPYFNPRDHRKLTII